MNKNSKIKRNVAINAILDRENKIKKSMNLFDSLISKVDSCMHHVITSKSKLGISKEQYKKITGKEWKP